MRPIRNTLLEFFYSYYVRYGLYVNQKVGKGGFRCPFRSSVGESKAPHSAAREMAADQAVGCPGNADLRRPARVEEAEFEERRQVISEMLSLQTFSDSNTRSDGAP
jgi:hypothetical protein